MEGCHLVLVLCASPLGPNDAIPLLLVQEGSGGWGIGGFPPGAAGQMNGRFGAVVVYTVVEGVELTVGDGQSRLP